MLLLNPDEKILLTMRRHWFYLVGPVVLFVALLTLPSLFLAFAPSYLPILNRPEIAPLASFFLAIYVMGVLTFALIKWLVYYLDVWIITDRRIIDIEQRGLFNRAVSELTLDRVQDVTVEVLGIVPTMLKFGTIRIQSAGEVGEFTIDNVPHCDKAKDIILKSMSRYMSARH